MNDFENRGGGTNTAGLVGFILSLVGLLGTCGLLSPIGLIFSLVGLGKEPRGFAIAGTILGILGSLWIVFLVGVVGLGVIVAAVGVGAAAFAMIGMGQNAIEVAQQVQAYHENNGAVPASLTELNLPADDLQDPWGNRFRYMPGPDGDTFVLISNGQDGNPDTGDDITAEIDLSDGFSVNIKQGDQEIFDSSSMGGETEGEQPASDQTEQPPTPETPPGG